MLSRKSGRKIAIIKEDENNKKKKKKNYIYISDNTLPSKDITITKHITLTNGKFQPLPNTNMIERIYITAPSGAGKSTFAGKWINEALKMSKYRDDEIILLSSIDDDKNINKFDPLVVELNASLITDPLTGEDFRNSITIFDDTDTIQNKEICKAVLAIKNFLLEQGRHYKTKMLITSHLLSDREKTRRALNECTSIVFFPIGPTLQIRKFMKDRLGLSKQQIAKVMKLKNDSRWISIYLTYPMYVISEKTIFILDDSDENY
jgi:ABC-type multidrug transport system fused ATPase/permease subunit